MVVLGGWAFSYERGTPVPCSARPRVFWLSNKTMLKDGGGGGAFSARVFFLDGEAKSGGGSGLVLAARDHLCLKALRLPPLLRLADGSGPLRAVHLARHKCPEGLVN